MAVARALEEERHLVVEAGTGVGKSIAYLVPAILFALEQKKKAIISTHTINLQEQLLDKDIPILKKILPVEFEAALMKGRQNYLCPRRLQRAMQQAGELFTTSEQAELVRLAEWAAKTTRRFAERSRSRAGPESLGAGLQRSAHLHDQDLRPNRELFFPAGAQTAARGGRDCHQSHPALHAARRAGRTGGTRERLSFPERLHHFRRSAHRRANRVAPDRDRRFAVRARARPFNDFTTRARKKVFSPSRAMPRA